MKFNILFLLFLLPFVCCAQEMNQIDENTVCIKGDTILYYDAEGFAISRLAHSDSLKTHKYIISFKGNNGKAEIHLVYKYPKLKTLIGRLLPQVIFFDIKGKPVGINEKDITVICFWDKYCSSCIRELIVLDILAVDYPNVAFVALTPDSCEEVRNLMKKLRLKWENIAVVPAYDGEFTDILHIFVYPSNVILDKNRVVRGVTVGGNIRLLLSTLEEVSGKD